MIPYTDFSRLLTDTTEFSTLEAYTAECGGSAPLDDVQDVCKLLERIWIMGHHGMSVQSVMSACGESLHALSRAYGVPYRTLQDWKLGNRTPPEWQLPLLAYAVLSDLDWREGDSMLDIPTPKRT